jgi:Skp family chaperone for outer membrane proteins
MRHRLARTTRCAAAAALLSLSMVSAPLAQGVLVVDIERVLQEAAAAVQLRAFELEERRSIRNRLDALQQELSAEEAALNDLRGAVDAGSAPREAFDERVQAFDRKVRAARSMARDAVSGLEQRFTQARQALRAAVGPLLDALIAERAASIVVDASAVLRAAPSADATDAVIAGLDAAWPAASARRLLPQPDPPPPRAAAGAP